MGITVWPVDAVGGAPEYSGRDLRQALSPALAGATATRPLGALSGVRPGTPTDTVEVSGSTWTCHPHAGIIDGQSAAEAGPYWYAVDADVTGSVDAANATNPRKDLIYARISDPAESDGSTDPEVEILYLAGTAASSPTPPATPARSIPLAVLNVPKAGGGSVSVTWVAPYMAAPGGFVLVRNTAERAALAAAWAPTAENPLRVHRTDAGAGRELEYTTDGTTWHAVLTGDTGWGDTGWQAATPASGWATYTTLRTRLVGGVMLAISGLIRANGGTVPSGTSAAVATLAAGHRPTTARWVSAAGWVNGATTPYQGDCVVEIVAATGVVNVYAPALKTGVYIDTTIALD